MSFWKEVVMKSSKRVRSIAILLRVLAISVIISGGSLFLPEAWINSFLEWCGVGQMPHEPQLRYLLWGCGYLALAWGVFIWVIAMDVMRYRPIIITVLVAFLIAAPTFYLIGNIAGLPRWWCIVDFISCFLAGAVPLTFFLWPAKASPGGKIGGNKVAKE